MKKCGCGLSSRVRVNGKAAATEPGRAGERRKRDSSHPFGMTGAEAKDKSKKSSLKTGAYITANGAASASLLGWGR
jgi:hypothetical protein